jgi:hypothetical protein
LLAHICMSDGEDEMFERFSAFGATDAVVVSLRRFTESRGVQASGVKALWCYMLCGGDALRDAGQAALVALRAHGEDLDVARLTFDMLVCLKDDEFRPHSWLLPTLGTPEAVALLSRSLALLDRAGNGGRGYTTFVQCMKHGACTGCGTLQEKKMKRCSRCDRAPYCSPECQRADWARHKRECVRPGAAASGSASAA